MTKSRTSDFSELTTEELRAELARRKASELPDNPTISQIEDMQIELGGDRPKAFGSMLERLGLETGKPMGCPACGKRSGVKERCRPRTIQSLASELTFTRNYRKSSPVPPARLSRCGP